MTAPAQSPPGAIVGFADPAAVGATRPAVRDFVGRVVVIRPTRLERDIPNKSEPDKKQDRITADVLVLNGGPMEFGGNVARGNPLTMRVDTPFLVKNMYISNKNIVDAVEGQVGRGVVLGRVAKGKATSPTHNDPFNLDKVELSDPMYGAAITIYTQVVNDVFVNPEPVKIGAAPTTAPAQQQVDPWATATPAQAPTPPAEDPAAAFARWQAEQAAKAAPAETIPAAPNGWPEETWRGLTKEQRQKVLDSVPPFQ